MSFDRCVLPSGLTVLVMLLAAHSAGAQNGITSRDLMKLRSVGEVALSPDRAHVAYGVTVRERPGRPASEVWILTVASGERKRLGNGGPASSPRWSADGKAIAYFGREGDKSGVVVSAPDGSNPVFIAAVDGTNHPLPGAGDRLAWSPDGKRIAFVSAVAGPETKEATGDPVVITRYLYKPTAGEGLTRFNDNKRLHIFVADIATKQVRQLTDGTNYEHSLDWSPVGDEILFVSNHEPDPDRFFNYDIFAVRVADGVVRQLTRTEAVEYRPSWSPDGKTIAYQGTKRGLTSSETTMEDTHVWLMNADGTNPRELGAAIDNRQGVPQWAPDGASVYFTLAERGSTHLYRLPAAGGKAELVIGEGSVGSWGVGATGTIGYALSTGRDMPELYLKTAGAAKQVTNLNDTALAGKAIAPVQAFTFLSFDGMPVEAFLTEPLGRSADSRHPMIVTIHGGPHGQQGPAFNHKAQVYAAQGWASLAVNYRGSTGYGQKFTDAIFRDQNGAEAKDVLYAVDAALRRNPWLDPDRLGVEGGSYGGQLTDWLITQTGRFKAAIPSAGISNLVSFNYMSYYHDYLAVEFGAFPHQEDLMDLLWERSPLKHVANVRTPVMFIHGENDNDVPIAEDEQYFIALKDVGVETVMLRYPREGHGLAETGHQIDAIDRSIGWYNKHFMKADSRPHP